MKKRAGSAARRQLEFDVIQDQIKRRKAKFLLRLERWVVQEGECHVWTGEATYGGDGSYRRMNFNYKGQHVGIGVHRVFLIMKLKRPIAIGHDAAHSCGNRRCVKHVFEQYYTGNAAAAADVTNGKERNTTAV